MRLLVSHHSEPYSRLIAAECLGLLGDRSFTNSMIDVLSREESPGKMSVFPVYDT